MPNRITSNTEYPNIEKSKALYARAEALIPAGTQTLAKGPGQYVKGVAPIYLQRAKGARVWDVDGNEYLDFNMAIGPISLGYAYEKVDAAIRRQLEDGITFSLMHPLEVEVAELIQKTVPNVESVRYSKTGADATSCAVRISRAFTGRKKVVACGYHGWHDWYIGLTDRNKGIPEETASLTSTINYNDEASLAAIDNDTACVIMEPVLFDAPKNDFLKKVREVCNQKGALLIFDEMWTGFRMAMGGAQEYFGVKADLMTFSKAVANGMPISILAGRKDVMANLEHDVFFFTTFGGEALSLAATKATIEELQEKNVPQHIAKLGKQTREAFNDLAMKLDMPFIKCAGLDYRTIITLAADAGPVLEMKSLVQQELIKRGILWTGTHTICYSHTSSDIDYLIDSYKEVLPILRTAVQEKDIKKYLKGEPVKPVFRTTTGSIAKK